ncbi:MAG: thioester domain-containing protein [Clostridia bacterium]|nr:thioester domain-containing protein [Clostridia bacterium]
MQINIVDHVLTITNQANLMEGTSYVVWCAGPMETVEAETANVHLTVEAMGDPFPMDTALNATELNKEIAAAELSGITPVHQLCIGWEVVMPQGSEPLADDSILLSFHLTDDGLFALEEILDAYVADYNTANPTNPMTVDDIILVACAYETRTDEDGNPTDPVLVRLTDAVSADTTMLETEGRLSEMPSEIYLVWVNQKEMPEYTIEMQPGLWFSSGVWVVDNATLDRFYSYCVDLHKIYPQEGDEYNSNDPSQGDSSDIEAIKTQLARVLHAGYPSDALGLSALVDGDALQAAYFTQNVIWAFTDYEYVTPASMQSHPYTAALYEYANTGTLTGDYASYLANLDTVEITYPTGSLPLESSVGGEVNFTVSANKAMYITVTNIPDGTALYVGETEVFLNDEVAVTTTGTEFTLRLTDPTAAANVGNVAFTYPEQTGEPDESSMSLFYPVVTTLQRMLGYRLKTSTSGIAIRYELTENVFVGENGAQAHIRFMSSTDRLGRYTNGIRFKADLDVANLKQALDVGDYFACGSLLMPLDRLTQNATAQDMYDVELMTLDIDTATGVYSSSSSAPVVVMPSVAQSKSMTAETMVMWTQEMENATTASELIPLLRAAGMTVFSANEDDTAVRYVIYLTFNDNGTDVDEARQAQANREIAFRGFFVKYSEADGYTACYSSQKSNSATRIFNHYNYSNFSVLNAGVTADTALNGYSINAPSAEKQTQLAWEVYE